MRPFSIQSKKLTKIVDRPLIKDIDFTAYSGEIHAIIGNNGEGKTVFASLLAGVRTKTSGSILLDNKEINITSVISAQKHGIYMLQQEQVLFPKRSVRDNLIAGNEKMLGFHGILMPSKPKMNAICRQYLAQFGLESLDLDVSISALSPMEKLAIQLCRILMCKPRVLILDEPSTSLTTPELRLLFDFLEKFKKDTIVILITHNYSLLLRYCDRVSIINDGMITATFDREGFSHPRFNEYITNMKMNFTHPALPLTPGKKMVHIDHLSTRMVTDINFSLHANEIIGLAGLKTEEKYSLLNVLLGDDKPKSGSVAFPGTQKKPSISLISDHEADKNLFMTHSIPFNITASNFNKIKRYGFTSDKEMRLYGVHYLKKLGVKDADVTTKPPHLSTGTKQKVVIARSLFTHSNIYIYDEPTKNLDSSSKLDLYNILNALALEGATILLISSDYSELVNMCNRVVLMKDGKQIGNYSTQYLSVEALSNELQ